MALHDVITD